MRDIYTPKEAAFDMLSERRDNSELRAKVTRYLGGLVPDACFLADVPPAFLARYVPRATDEDRMFADQARQDGFVPYWSSYLADTYTVRNAEKVATIRPPIRWMKGQRTKQWIVAPEDRSGGIGHLETIFGYTSEEYQRGVRDVVFTNDGDANLVENTFDMSDWYRFQAQRFGWHEGNLAAYYYPATMALATTFGVLYEDFDGGPSAGNGDLMRFMDQVVYPAITKVTEDLGVAPVIVRLPYRDGMNETGLEFLDIDASETIRALGSKAFVSGKIGA